MTRMRTFLIPVLVGGALLVGAPPAQAAPGDCLVLAGRLVCEPYPDSDETPFYSICTVIPTLPEEGTLIRKSCQVYERATDLPVGEPQIFVYPPDDTMTPPPNLPSSEPTTVAPSPAAVRTTTTPSQVTRTTTRTETAAAAPETVRETVEVPAPTTTPATTSAPRTSEPAAAAPDWPGLTSDDDRENWFMSVSDGMLLGIAAVAGLVLLLAIVVPPVWRRRQAGAHRAP